MRIALPRWTVALLCLAGSAAADPVAAEPPATFTSPPVVKREGGGARIDFAVSRVVDVAVSIEDAAGRVTRHLAAGKLGPNAPAPLRPDSLAQSLAWDGRDDVGRTASGPLKVRVGVGLRPRFERLIGHQPADGGYVRALAAGPTGELFVFHSYGSHHPGDSSTAVCVLNRQGQYLRTIMPYPANLPAEKLSGLRRIQLADGSRVPFIYQVETRSLVPGLGLLPLERPVVTRDGRLAFVGIQEGPRAYARPGESRLTVIHTDGSVPHDGVLKTFLASASHSGGNLALSPDEKTLYLAGLSTCRPNTVYVGDNLPDTDSSPADVRPQHAVFRFGWADSEITVFAGDKDRAGNGHDRLSRPASVATDAQGNVYVADTGNNRIAVFRPDGGFLAQVPVESPHLVEVSRRTGAFYVVSRGKTRQLIKFDGFAGKREVSRLALPPEAANVAALDDSADPAVLWLSNVRPNCCMALLRVEDKGNSFGQPLDVSRPFADGPNSIGAVYDLSVDRQRGLIYINNYWRYDVASDTWRTLPRPEGWGPMWPNNTPNSSTGTVGLDGHYYMNIGAHGARVHRYSPALEERPFANPASSPLVKEAPRGWIGGYARTHGQGLTADSAGNVYVIWKKTDKAPNDAHRAAAVYVYDPDGRLKKDKLIDAAVPNLNSVRVDFAGNVYLAVGLRPGRERLPPGLSDRLSGAMKDDVSVSRINGYPLIYGSIIKFAPEGGVIRDGIGGVECNYAHGTPIQVQGAKWIFSGASPAPSWATPKGAANTLNICLCEIMAFDVDGFGRSFFPDAGRCRVGVIDTAGNEICWFGAYGNCDSAGPGSAIAQPDIPFCWPQAVAVADRAAYIGDRLNRRIVAVELKYEVEATCPIP